MSNILLPWGVTKITVYSAMWSWRLHSYCPVSSFHHVELKTPELLPSLHHAHPTRTEWGVQTVCRTLALRHQNKTRKISSHEQKQSGSISYQSQVWQIREYLKMLTAQPRLKVIPGREIVSVCPTWLGNHPIWHHHSRVLPYWRFKEAVGGRPQHPWGQLWLHPPGKWRGGCGGE